MGFFDPIYRTIHHLLFDYDWVMGVIVVVMLLIALTAIGAAAFGLFYLADTCFLPTRQEKGMINGKDYMPETTILTPIGGMLFPRTIPAAWSVNVLVGKRQAWVNVNPDYYKAARYGQPVTVRSANRRFTGRLHLKAVL